MLILALWDTKFVVSMLKCIYTNACLMLPKRKATATSWIRHQDYKPRFGWRSRLGMLLCLCGRYAVNLQVFLRPSEEEFSSGLHLYRFSRLRMNWNKYLYLDRSEPAGWIPRPFHPVCNCFPTPIYHLYKLFSPWLISNNIWLWLRCSFIFCE